MITHSNIMCSISGALLTLPVKENEEQVCFLPLCHILERLIDRVRADRAEVDGQFR